jgi:glycosyltransferase involved in cell wall biosynthesis
MRRPSEGDAGNSISSMKMLSDLAARAKLLGITQGGHDVPSPILVDATALDTGHRGRGIGRYVGGLLGGLSAELAAHAWGGSVVALRLDARFDAAPPTPLTVAGATRGSVSLPVWRLCRPLRAHRPRWVVNELSLGAELRRVGCRLFHATEQYAVPAGRGFRSVATVHDLIPLVFPDHYMNWRHAYWKAYYAWMAATERWKHIDRFIAISEATKREMIERLDVPAERIDVVHNGVDHDLFAPVDDASVKEAVRQRYGLETPFLLYIGGYDYRKNIEALVRAMAFVPRSLDVRLVLAGGMDAAERAAFDDIARGARVRGRITYLGYVDDRDVPALYSLAEAFAYPSLAEGFGLQALEAMACGCPVVSSDASSLPEVVGEAGRLFDPRAPEEIGKALAAVLEDGALRAEMRARGLVRARQFSWERCARETLKVYERALDPR